MSKKGFYTLLEELANETTPEEVVVTSEETTTVVNETTTRVNPSVPETGAPVEPIPQEDTVDTTEEGVIELPADVEPEEVQEAITQVEETVQEIETSGVTPQTMKYINMAWGGYLASFGLSLPSMDVIKENSINLRAAASVSNTLIALQKHLKRFKTSK